MNKTLTFLILSIALNASKILITNTEKQADTMTRILSKADINYDDYDMTNSHVTACLSVSILVGQNVEAEASSIDSENLQDIPLPKLERHNAVDGR